MWRKIFFVTPSGFHTPPAALHSAIEEPNLGVRAAAGVVNQADNRHLLKPGYFTTPGWHHTTVNDWRSRWRTDLQRVWPDDLYVKAVWISRVPAVDWLHQNANEADFSFSFFKVWQLARCTDEHMHDNMTW